MKVELARFILLSALAFPPIVDGVGNCPSGWLHAYNQRLCMKFSDNKLGYSAAEASCEDEDAAMVTYSNRDELVLVMSLFQLSGTVRKVQHGLRYNPNTLEATIPDGSTVECDFCDSLNYTDIATLPACIAIVITEEETSVEASSCGSKHFVCSKDENSLLAGIPFTTYDAAAAGCGALLLTLLIVTFLCCKPTENSATEEKLTEEAFND